MKRLLTLFIFMMFPFISSAQFTVSGNTGLAAANMQWIGAPTNGIYTTGHVTADGAGAFTSASIPNGTYEFRPYSPGFTFSPAFSQQTISGGNITGVNFTATAIGSTGVWQPQGVVMVPTTADLNSGSATSGTQEATVVYEANPHLISANPDGDVFKMWFACGVDICYAESNDGLTSWVRQGAKAITGIGNPRIFINGGTYYLYGTVGASGGNINQYTSSDGTSFTLAHSSVLTPGAANTWDSGKIWDFQVVEIVGGTWKALYTGAATGNNQFNEGEAESPDGITWTKYGSNPVLLDLFSVRVFKVSSTYYCWGTTSVFLGNAAQPFGIPTEGGRASSSDLKNWTGVTNVFQRVFVNEGFGGAAKIGQSGTFGAFVEVSGKLYYYYTTAVVGSDGLDFSVKASLYNGTIASLVATNEQVGPSITQPANGLSVVHVAFGGGSGSTSAPTTSAVNQGAGHLIVVGIRLGAVGQTIASVPTDTAGNTYVALTANIPGVNFGPMQMFYVKNCLGNASNVVTAHFSASYTFTAVVYWDVSGADTVNPLDAQSTFAQSIHVRNVYTTLSTVKPNEIVLVLGTGFIINDTFGTYDVNHNGVSVFDGTFPTGAGNLYCGASHVLLNYSITNGTVGLSNQGAADPMQVVSASFISATQGADTHPFNPF